MRAIQEYFGRRILGHMFIVLLLSMFWLQTQQIFAWDRLREVIPVAVHDEDGRKTEAEYAKAHGSSLDAVRKRFAATGKIECGSRMGSAALVVNASTIVTVGHVLRGHDGCSPEASPLRCEFKVDAPGTMISVPILRIVSIGLECPRGKSSIDDWAVLTLTREVPGIAPYKLAYSEPGFGETPEAVISVNALNRDFSMLSKNGSRYFPKTIEDCETKKVYRSGVFESNCDSAQGTSGSSIIRTTRFGDALVGITVGNYEEEDFLNAAIARNWSNRGEYRAGKWGSVHIPISGALLLAITNIKNERGRESK